MKAAVGGVLNLFLVTIFIVIISSLLLFNVSYAKSFRVKNKIITTYEQYEGNCGDGTACNQEIANYEERLGYRANNMNADTSKNEQCFDDLGYCVITRNVSKGGKVVAHTYKIRTEVRVRFPFVEEILGLGVFGISGETKAVYIR